MDLEFFDTVNKAMRAFSREFVYTSLPAVVVSNTDFESKQTIDVQPLIGRLWDDKDYEDPPTIFKVPVIFPSAGGGILSFPIQIGDTVMLMFSQRDIENFQSSDGRLPQKPKTPRDHALTDAIAIAGLTTNTNHLRPNPKDVELKWTVAGETQSRITLRENNDIDIATTGNLIATVDGDTTVNSTGKITLQSQDDIDIIAGGNVNITGTAINLN